MPTVTPPLPTEYPSFYGPYIQAVTETDLTDALQANLQYYRQITAQVPVAKANYAYAEGKWTIKEVLLHINDAERIFAYRALRFARKDETPLPGFDEATYTPNSFAAERTLISIVDEFVSIREATCSLFNSFNAEALARTGTANGKPVSVKAIGYIIAGHAQHHLGVLQQRYL